MTTHTFQFSRAKSATELMGSAARSKDATGPASPVPILGVRDVDELHGSTPVDRAEAHERALVYASRAGDRGALEELLSLHQSRVFGVCLSMCGDPELARDLSQDALVKVILGLPTFGFRSRLSTWITRVTINVCLTDRRKRRIRRTVSLDSLAPRAGTTLSQGLQAGGGGGGGGGGSVGGNLADLREPGVVEAVESRESQERLSRAFSRLDPQQRAILILRDGQGLDYAEIATILETPDGTVKSRLFRARAALRKEMERLTSDPPDQPSPSLRPLNGGASVRDQ